MAFFYREAYNVCNKIAANSDEMIDVSIIICTRDRSSMIEGALDAIAGSIRNTPNKMTEIIIVDNGSKDTTPQIIRSWHSQNADINVIMVHEAETGLSNARNAGVQASNGHLVIFADDDCRMAEDYIVQAVFYDEADISPVIRGGRIELGNADDLPLTIKTSNDKETWRKSEHSAKYKTIRGSISGANMVMRRSILDKVGKFDPLLGVGQKIAGSEDTDYLCRAYLMGIDIEYVPDMTVYHFHGRKKKEDAHKLLRQYNIGGGAVYFKHMLADFDLFRPFIWNIKCAIREIKTRQNLYLPAYDFSYRGVVLCNLYGMILYVGLSLKAVLIKKWVPLGKYFFSQKREGY